MEGETNLIIGKKQVISGSVENMKKISNYVEKIPYKNQVILFHKINGNIVLMENDNIVENDDSVFVNNLSEEELAAFEELDFFVSDFEIQEYIRTELSNSCITEKTTVVLSVTEECNLACAYCYQADWNKRERISAEAYIDLVMDYMEEILPQIAMIEGTLDICFMGGEPLLRKDIIVQVVKKISEIGKKEENKKATIHFYIDTNAIFLTREFLLNFPNLTVNTTLSLPADHNKLRSNSYEAVLQSLQSVANLFDDNKYKLIIRYNVHHDNIMEIDEFLGKFHTLGIKYTLDIQNIMNQQNECFKNKLSDIEFQKRYLNDIVPILRKNAMEVDLLPKHGLSRQCLGIGKFNRKFYSNGKVVLCDAFAKDSICEYKDVFNPLPEKCIKCFDFPYCGGPKPCKPDKCTGEYREKDIVRKKIICYVENEEGKKV